MSPDMNQNHVSMAQQSPIQNVAQTPVGSPDPASVSADAGFSQSLSMPTQLSADALMPIPPEAVQLQAAEQVNQLIAQHGHDPYKLSEALGQLRSVYVAEQYHVGPSNSEGGH